MANSCETCKHYEVESYNEPCISCRFKNYDVPTKWENPFRQKTNADRIRAMSDEELAKLIVKHKPLYSWCKGVREIWMKPNVTKVQAWLEWLKQPAEEDHHA